MEVTCIETAAFYELVKQVTEHLISLYGEKPFKWVGQDKAMEMLGIKSKTTLQKFRDEGKIRFSQPEPKIILYDRDSIEAFLDRHAREVFWKKKGSF